MTPRHRQVLDLRCLGLPEVPELGRYRYPAARSALPPHEHRQAFEICYLAEGRQCYRVAGVDHHLRGGEVFFTRPDEVHSTGGRPEERGTLYWLVLRRPVAGRRWLGLEADEAAAWARAMSAGERRQFRGGEEVHRAFDAVLAAAASAGNALGRAELRLAVGHLLLTVRRAAVAPASPGPAARLQRALAWVEARGPEPVRLAAWARATGLSLPRFKAWFRIEMGMAPGAWLTRRRVERAQTMLCQETQPITTIAHELGFGSSQHFATVFKRHTGLTPGAWRQGHAVATTRRRR
jgi:AraC-like DNA-binding protein